MEDQQPTAQGSAAPASLTGKPFAEMTAPEKLAWIGKVSIMLITGGFAYPNIFTD